MERMQISSERVTAAHFELGKKKEAGVELLENRGEGVSYNRARSTYIILDLRAIYGPPAFRNPSPSTISWRSEGETFDLQ